MSQVIDATGLPPEAVQAVETLVQMLRMKTQPLTPNEESPEEWSARLRTWCESHPKRDVVIDDSRETIYEGRGE